MERALAAKGTPDLRGQVFGGVGHYLPEEAPETFARAIPDLSGRHRPSNTSADTHVSGIARAKAHDSSAYKLRRLHSLDHEQGKILLRGGRRC